MKMNIRNIFLGFNEYVKGNKNKRGHNKYHLLKVPFKRFILKAISKRINIKDQRLQSLKDAWENLSSKRESFSVTTRYRKPKSKKDKLMVDSNNYCFNMIFHLARILVRKNANISLFKNSKDILNFKNNKYVYKYVIYVGTLNHYPHIFMFSIFPIKNDFLLNSRNIYCTIFGHGVPTVSPISTDKLFQLPSKKTEDIANFYAGHPFKLRVYKPIVFDDLFNTNGVKKVYATKTLTKFKNGKLSLTKNKMKVRFINRTGNANKIKDTVLHDSDLLDSMSTFTGNKNSTIQRVSSSNLINVLRKLKTYVNIHRKSCPFNMKNIPCIDKQNNILNVTPCSMPIFCSLLRNDIVRKLLTGEGYIPYYYK